MSDRVDTPHGTAFICGRGRRSKPCAYCGSASSRLCDFPVLRRVARGRPGIRADESLMPKVRGTCDEPLCDRCTSKIAGDGDLCRAHAPLWDAALGKPTVGPGA